MTTNASASFKLGDEAAEELAQSTQRGGAFPRAHYLNAHLSKDGAKVVVRMLGERLSWINVLQHIMAPTRPAPSGFSGKWPEKMDATCRKDPQFAAFQYEDCYICDNYKNNFDSSKQALPSARSWTLCVVREPVVVDGRIAGYKDAMREETVMADGKPTEQKMMVPDVCIASYSYDAFFKALRGFSTAYGTLMDRDYLITRGTKKVGRNDAADYSFVPLDKMFLDAAKFPGVYYDLSDHGLAEMSKATGVPFTLGQLYPNLPDIGGIVTERSSDDYYARFFDLRKAQPTRKTDAEQDSGGESTSGAEAAAGVQAPDVAPDAMAAMLARLQPQAYPTAEAPKG